MLLPALKTPLDGIIWLIACLTRPLNGGGLTARIEGETDGAVDEAPDEKPGEGADG